MEELKKRLEKLALEKCRDDSDDFEPMDYSGGNFDDCYLMGVADGETHLARELLDEFFK